MRTLVLICMMAGAVLAQKPLDLVLVLEPVNWAEAPGGRVARTEEELKLRPEDRLAVVELEGAPKVKAKLGEGKTKVGMRWRPTFRFGAAAQGPEQTGRRVYDALVLATQLLPDDYDPTRQRAILLVTANEELGSKAKLKDAVAALSASQARLAILAEPAPKQKVIRRGVGLQSVAEGVEGEFHELQGNDPLNAAIERLRRERP
jgi:hypothetical protein